MSVSRRIMIFWSFVLSSALLASCGIAAIYSSLASRRGRRTIVGAAFICLSAAAFLMTGNGSLPAPRAVIVIVAQEQKDPADLQGVLRSLRWFDQVAIVSLELDSTYPDSTPTFGSLQWTFAGWYDFSDPERVNEFSTSNSAKLKTSPTDWDALFQYVQGRAVFLMRPTIVVVHDGGSTWSNAKVATSFSELLGAKFKQVDRNSVDVIIYSGRGSQLRSGLSAEITRSPIPAVRPVDLGATKVNLFLSDEEYRVEGTPYKLSVSVDGSQYLEVAGFKEGYRTKNTDTPFLIERRLSVDLGSIEGTLQPGFHLLRYRLDVVGKDVNYVCQLYFEVAAEKVGIVGRHGDLAEPTWRRYFPTGGDTYRAGKLAADWAGTSVGRRYLQGEARRSNLTAFDLWEMGDSPVAPSFDWATFRRNLDQTRTIVFVEPTLAELYEVEKQLAPPNSERSMHQRIEDGLVVGIVGPPKLPATIPMDSLPWLTAVRIDDSSDQHDIRVYFCFEQAPYIQANDNGSAAISLFQSTVANELCASLQASALPWKPRTGSEVFTTIKDNLVHCEISQPLYGRLPTSGLKVHLMPPMTLGVSNPEARGMMHAPSAMEGAFWEMSGSQMRPRLGLLFGFSTSAKFRVNDFFGSNYRPLDPEARYTHTHVVYFASKDFIYPVECSAKAPLRLTSAMGSKDFSSGDTVYKTLSDLAKQGIVVHLVDLPGFTKRDPLGNTTPEAYGRDLKPALNKTENLNAEFQKVRLSRPDWPGPYTQPIAKDAAQAIAANITAHSKKSSLLTRSRMERVIDVRGRRTSYLPATSYPIRPRHPAATTLAHFGKPTEPAVIATQIHQGTVVVFGYSMFSAEHWRGDAATSTIPFESSIPHDVPQIAALSNLGVGNLDWKNQLQSDWKLNAAEADAVLKEFAPHAADGWGLQRLLDLAELTALPRTSSSAHPIVQGIELSPDNRVLTVNLLADFTKAEPSEPVLKGADIAVVDTDVLSQRMSLRITADSAIKSKKFGVDVLKLHPTLTHPRAAVPIYLDLASSRAGPGNVREALIQYSTAFGGEVVDKSRIETAMNYRGALTSIALLLLCGGCLLAFLPREFRSLFGQKELTPRKGGLIKRHAFDVDGILKEWGANVGSPRAARIAGLPAGQKPFEPGDSLGAARRSDMVAFSSVGCSLPPKKPIVRRRTSSKSMLVRVLFDCSPSLRLPLTRGVSTKLALMKEVIHFIAGAAWLCSGNVVIAPLQKSERDWGPHGAGGEIESALKFVDQQLSQHQGSFDTQFEWTAGEVVIIVSDGLVIDVGQLKDWGAAAVSEGSYLRFVQITTPFHSQEVGLCRSVLTGMPLDRREWEPHNVEAAFRRLSDSLRNACVAADIVYAETSAEDLSIDVFEKLISSGIIG